LIVAQLQAMLRVLLQRTELEPARTIASVNSFLCDDLPADRFVTTFCGILEPDRNEMLYCSAGQGPIIHVRSASRTVDQFPATHCPLGVVDDLEFRLDRPIAFATGDVLVLVTDGFYEWANRRKEQFGIERLTELAMELATLDADEILMRIRERVVAFSAGTEQMDDLTAIIIKRTN